MREAWQLTLCLLCVLWVHGGASIAVTAQPSTIRTIDKGDQSNVDAARQAVARTEAEWSALWKSHDFNRPMPKVDFSKEMVVAVFMGSRPSAGFATEITRVEPRDEGLVVRYREVMPAPGRMTAQVLTAPFHIAAVPKKAGKVTFEKR